MENSSHKQETLVQIHMPAKVDVELVQANELRHYEISFALFSLLFSLASGFWTAYFLADKQQPTGAVLASSIVFSVLTVLFFALALYQRSRVYGGTVKKSAPLTAFESQTVKLLPPGQRVREDQKGPKSQQILTTVRQKTGKNT